MNLKVRYLGKEYEVEKKKKVTLEGKENTLLYFKNGMIVNEKAVEELEYKNSKE